MAVEYSIIGTYSQQRIQNIVLKIRRKAYIRGATSHLQSPLSDRRDGAILLILNTITKFSYDVLYTYQIHNIIFTSLYRVAAYIIQETK